MRQVGVGQDDATEADEIDQVIPNCSLADVGQILLQVGVCGSDETDVGIACLDLSDEVDLAGHVYERVDGWLISVRRWVVSGALNVRVVIRAARSQVDQRYVKFPEKIDKLASIRGVRFDRIVLVRAEPVLVGKQIHKRFGDAGTQATTVSLFGVRPEGHEIESAQPDADVQSGVIRPDALHDLSQEACAVLEGSTVGSRTCEGAQELVAEVSVTVLDVDELLAEIGRHRCGAMVVLDQGLDFII